MLNPGLRLRRRLVAIGAGAVVFGIFVLLSWFPAVAERVYGDGIGPVIASLLSRLSGVIPLSIAELLIVAFLIRQLAGAARSIAGMVRRDRGIGNAVAAALLRMGSDVGIAVALFYLLWGFHYARLPMDQRYGWDASGATPEEVAALAQEMVEAGNFAYVTLHGSEDLGEVTGPVLDDPALQETLLQGWKASEKVVGRSSFSGFSFGRPKPLLASRLLDYLGISGFYFPWTGEANFNRDIPPLTLPQAVAHEMAHQRGFAREDEANFMGYLVAAAAPHTWAQYSADVFAQRQLLAAVARYDRPRAVDLVKERLPGVQRDIDAANAYWRRFLGPASDAARAVNDAYLRSNRVPGGVASYGRSVEHLIAYARSRGGWLLR